MNPHEILTKLDEELMSEINNINIEDIIKECHEIINEQFIHLDFKVRDYNNLEILEILTLIDKIIPGIPQTEYIFEQLYKNEIVQNLVNILIFAAKKQFETNDIDALANPKLDHPLKILNQLPYYMKKFIVYKSYEDLLGMKLTIAYGVVHMMKDRKNKYLAYSTDKAIFVLDLRSYKIILTIVGPNEYKSCHYTYTFTNCNELIVAIDPKYSGSTIQVWNLVNSTMKDEFIVPNRVMQVTYLIAKRVMFYTDQGSYIGNLEDKTMIDTYSVCSSHDLNQVLDQCKIISQALIIKVSLPKLNLFNLLVFMTNGCKNKLNQLFESQTFKEIPQLFHEQLREHKYKIILIN